MNPWIWFFILLLSFLIVPPLMSGNFEYILEDKINTLPILFFIITVSITFNYISLRIFSGEMEAFSTAIISASTGFLYNYLMGLFKENH